MFDLDLEGWIATSRLDTDFYKFPMGQIEVLKYPYIPATFALTNRTKDVRLAEIISVDELTKQLDHYRTLRYDNSQLHYLRGTNEYQERMFREEYLQFLKASRPTPYHLGVEDGQFQLEFPGFWAESSDWEMPGLYIINELRIRNILKRMSKFERHAVMAEGVRRLMEKIKILKTRPDITFIEFGTRRRALRQWQRYVVEVLLNELPGQFLGSSNVELSVEFGTEPKGTDAHERTMVMACLLRSLLGDEQGILQAQGRAMEDWWEMYGAGLSILLPDTFGTDFTLRIMTEEQARNWKGFRHDSGDPIEFGEKIIRFYQKFGIDPRTKMIVFSDGLDVHEILRIADHFKGRIKVTFGWGTNLTNDLGIKALSLVIKVIWACGFNAVKLSDNLAKIMGADAELFKRICGYANTESKLCVY